MADLTDVEDALVNLIAQTVYPVGIGQPSIANTDVRIYPGWPDADTLDVDLKAGKAHINVFPRPTESNTTRYPRKWETQAIVPATLAATVSGQTVTISGTVSTPQNVGILVDKAPYLYAVQVNDTLTSIAAALAGLIPGATAAGSVVTLPATVSSIIARVGTAGTSRRELGRQNRQFQVTVWANTPQLRTTLAKAVDPALRAVDFLSLPDGTGGRVQYHSSIETDALQKENLYRRDLIFSVEYATTDTRTDYQIIAAKTTLEDGFGNPLKTINE